MSKSSLEQLMVDGRDFLTYQGKVPYPVACEDFDRWDGTVARWIRHNADKAKLGEWSGFDRPHASDGPHEQDFHAAYWSRFVKSVQKRLKFLGTLDDATNEARAVPITNKVFIVHGHDAGTRETVARFLEQLELEVIILDEQPSHGGTLIEKLERYSDVSYAVVLFTGDDIGGVKGGDQAARARQNVVFELGYFVAKLGRGKCCLLRKDAAEIMSDFQGVAYVSLDIEDWRTRLAKEIDAAGLPVDMNNLLRK